MLLRLLPFLLICLYSHSMAAENPPFAGGPVNIELNSSKCTVHFTLGALLHTVHGTFRVKGGTVRFDPASGRAGGQIVVEVKSGETGDSARDQQMHDAVLESKRFPDAVFSPDQVKGSVASSGDSRVEVHGIMRVHGGEHEMTMPATVKVENNILTAVAKFEVPYVAWGMKDPSNFMLRVDKTVNVEVELTGKIANRTPKDSNN